MKHYLYSIYDHQAEYYDKPIMFMNRAAAIRGFVDAGATGDTLFGNHPEHFELCEIGTFDQSTGIVDAFSAPYHCGTLAMLRRALKHDNGDKYNDFTPPQFPEGEVEASIANGA